MNYVLHFNVNRAGYLMITCCFDHYVRCVRCDGSAVAFDTIRCGDCEAHGRHIYQQVGTA